MTRLFTIVLLILLLPLRGWSAERMADQMVWQPAAAITSSSMVAAMPADCPMMAMQMLAVHKAASADNDNSSHAAAVEGDGHGGETVPSPSSGRACQSCQLCMSLATPAASAVQAVSDAPQSVAVHRADRFVSADIAPLSKPPIS